MRFALGLGYSWMEEIIRMLFVWVIFVGAVAAMRRHLHIRVEAGLLLFPTAAAPARRMARRPVAVRLLPRRHVARPASSCCRARTARSGCSPRGVSMFWPYLIVPISFGLQALRLALWRFGCAPGPAADARGQRT